MKNKITKRVAYLLVFVLLSTLLIIGGSFYFIIHTKEDVDALNKNFLSEIAAQNATMMKKTVQIHLDKLSAISNVIANDINEGNAMDILASESKRSSFKRMGIADLQGNAISTDGEHFSVADRMYFKNAVKGQDTISDRLIDVVGGGYINVYAVPLYHGNEIKGVVFATNRNDDFIEVLRAKPFNGEGYSYVVKQDGSLIAYPSKQNGETSDLSNLFDEIIKSENGQEKVNKIKEDMKHEDAGYVSYTWDGTDRIGAYCKIGIEDWYAVTLVSNAVISSNSDRIIMRNLATVVLTASIFIALLVSIIFQNRKSQRRLEKIAYVDPLIGCANFNAFKIEAQRILKENVNRTYIFVKFDVDNFKFINDRFGFGIGDEVLINISDGLKQILQSGCETYARINADEFIILMENKHNDFLPEIRDAFVGIFNRLMGADFNHLIRFHSGLYIVPQSEKNFESIYEKVNYAHRQSKQMPLEDDIVEFYYNDAVRAEAKRLIEVGDHMNDALQNEEFEVYIQPKYQLNNELISGGEALVRWRQKDGTLLYPGSFIPLFEENGFIIKLDMYMFEHVCRLFQTWIEKKQPLVCISVNFSRLHLFNSNFVNDLIAMSDQYGVPRKYLELELTETVFFENQNLLSNVLAQAHEAGFTVSMDDFGNGYSSLGLLKNIHVDVIKIDRNFFVDDKDGERTNIVVEYVMKMAQKLGVHTLAEGVEIQEHIDMLKRFGCDYVQGYYYAKPMPIKDFEEQLNQEKGVVA